MQPRFRLAYISPEEGMKDIGQELEERVAKGSSKKRKTMFEPLISLDISVTYD